MSRDEMEKIAENMIGCPLDDQVKLFVQDKSGGLPSLCVELVKYLMESGEIYCHHKTHQIR